MGIVAKQCLTGPCWDWHPHLVARQKCAPHHVGGLSGFHKKCPHPPEQYRRPFVAPHSLHAQPLTWSLSVYRIQTVTDGSHGRGLSPSTASSLQAGWPLESKREFAGS